LGTSIFSNTVPVSVRDGLGVRGGGSARETAAGAPAPGFGSTDVALNLGTASAAMTADTITPASTMELTILFIEAATLSRDRNLYVRRAA
jgi:hypothetical protein